jgi:Ni/Co efflux regulator RcnB
MKKILSAAVALSVLAGTAGVASAAPYSGRYEQNRYESRYDGRYDSRYERGDHRGHRKQWRKGGRIDRNDWARSKRYDYRRHGLRSPPRGYEWRQTNTGEILLAAVATGLILELLSR